MIRDRKTAIWLNKRRRMLLDSGYTASATKFDGTNDYMLRGGDLTGAVDGQQLTISCWVNLNGGDAVDMYISSNENYRITLHRNASNKIRALIRDAASASIADMVTTTSYTSANGWLHILLSLDSGAVNSGYIYINDAAEVSGYNPLSSNNIDFTTGNYSIGAHTGAANKLNACLSEVYLTNEYIDISVESNRRKFIDAFGKPVDLGADGSTPTGTQPLLYLPNPFGTFEQNAGSGGNFTVTGALEACASSPSD